MKKKIKPINPFVAKMVGKNRVMESKKDSLKRNRPYQKNKTRKDIMNEVEEH